MLFSFCASILSFGGVRMVLITVSSFAGLDNIMDPLTFNFPPSRILPMQQSFRSVLSLFCSSIDWLFSSGRILNMVITEYGILGDCLFLFPGMPHSFPNPFHWRKHSDTTCPQWLEQSYSSHIPIIKDSLQLKYCLSQVVMDNLS